MKILVACEYSGRVREAFRAKGHNAWSCDLLPSEDASPYHVQCDVREFLAESWDMMIAFPSCTYLCSSGLHWNGRVPGRAEKTQEAIDFVKLLWSAPIKKIAIENPVGCLSTAIRKPDQIIQPHQYGEDASKATCLWLKELPPLTSTERVAGRLVTLSSGKTVERWANQTDSGQNKLAPSADRWKERSRTYQGIADAMAEQWGGV